MNDLFLEIDQNLEILEIQTIKLSNLEICL